MLVYSSYSYNPKIIDTLKIHQQIKKYGLDEKVLNFKANFFESIVFKNDSVIYYNPNGSLHLFEILLGELKEVELSKENYLEIIEYCKEREITFLCTAWDVPSVDFLESLNVPAYKISSGDMTNFPLIHHIAKLKKPLW